MLITQFDAHLVVVPVMLLIEMLLVLMEVPLPVWLIPHHSSHDIVSTMHRLFPAYMNGCRCLTGAFYVDRKAQRVQALELLVEATRKVSTAASSAVRSAEKMARARLSPSANSDEDSDGVNGGMGLMERALADIAQRTSSDEKEAVSRMIGEKMALISDPELLRRHFIKKDTHVWETLRNLAVYLIARFIFVKSGR